MSLQRDVRCVLITGGTGYIGRHLITYLLEQDITVVTFYRYVPPPMASLNLVAIKISDKKIENVSFFNKVLEKYKPDVVVHLATYYCAMHTDHDIEALISTNILLGVNILEAMKNLEIKKFVNAGTLWQNFENKKRNPLNLYAATKEALESLLIYYIEAHGFSAISLRLMDTYGRDDTREKLIPLLRRSFKEKKALMLSDGSQLISPLYIDDVVQAFSCAIHRVIMAPESSFYIYAAIGEETVTLQELVLLYEQVHSIKIPCKWGGKPNREREVLSPIDRVPLLPGWKPRIFLEEGLKLCG